MKDLLAHQPLAGEDVMRGDVFEGLDHPPSDAVLRHVKSACTRATRKPSERAHARRTARPKHSRVHSNVLFVPESVGESHQRMHRPPTPPEALTHRKGYSPIP